MVDRKFLEQYADMVREIPELEAKIDRLEAQIAKIEAEGAVKDTVSGGNGGTQHFVIEGFPIPEYKKKRTRLLSVKMSYEQLKNNVEEKVMEIETFIAGIDDSRIRRIITMKYIDGLSWTETAEKLGRYATADSARKEFERYFQRMS